MSHQASTTIRAAAVQLNSTGDKDRNLEVAERLVRKAAAAGAELIVLPEKWTLLGPPEAMLAGAEPIGGPSLGAVASWAREGGVQIVAGSIPESVAGEPRLFNTSVVIDPDGEIVASYRKIHLFDVDVGGVSYRESDQEQPGEEIVVAPLCRAGGSEDSLGLSVCYDLRFPELFRILAVRGARLVTVPSAFTAETGRDHWEVLLRARAIENQLFVVAAGQVGAAAPHFASWGHSMIVDPWGKVLAEAPDDECVVTADLDFGRQDEIRASLPSLANRRPETYVWPAARTMASAGAH